jgi:hypothetical protein
MERGFSAVTKRRVTKIMAETSRLNETEWWEEFLSWMVDVFGSQLPSDTSSYLRNFERVCKPSPIKIAIA